MKELNKPIKTTLFQNTKYLFKTAALAILSLSLVACGGGSGSSSDDSGNSSGSNTATLNMSAEPTTVESGQSAIITWQALNTVSCRAEDGWTTETKAAGNATVGPMTETTTYTMSCLGNEGGPISESITITVNNSTPTPEPTPQTPAPRTPSAPAPEAPAPEAPAPEAPAPEAPAPEAPAPEAPAPEAPAPEAPAPEAPAPDAPAPEAPAPEAPAPEAPAPKPSLNISANPSTVTENQNTTISWSSENTNSCTSVGGWASSTKTSGTQQVGPLSNTQEFRITCTSAAGGISKSVLVTVEPEASLGTAELSWTPSTMNVDGSTLTDLASYTIHYGTSSKNYTKQIVVSNPGITGYIIENLAPATYYFAIKAKDTAGNFSEFSNELSKSVQ